jgi:hypothetical protein
MGIPISQKPNTIEGLESRPSIRIHRIPAELPHSTNKSSKNFVEPKQIPTELLCLSYEDGSR